MPSEGSSGFLRDGPHAFYLQYLWYCVFEGQPRSNPPSDVPKSAEHVLLRSHRDILASTCHSFSIHLIAYNVESFESFGKQWSVKGLTLWLCVETSPRCAFSTALIVGSTSLPITNNFAVVAQLLVYFSNRNGCEFDTCLVKWLLYEGYSHFLALTLHCAASN